MQFYVILVQFTYLQDCPPKIEVIIGDARIAVVKAPIFNTAYSCWMLSAQT